MSSDILFTGKFELQKAYSDFDSFMNKIEKRIEAQNKKALQASAATAVSKQQAKVEARVQELYQETSLQAATAARKVAESQDRIRQAMNDGRISIDSGNKAIINLNRTLERYQRTLRDVELRSEESIRSNKSHILQLRRLQDTYDNLTTNIQRQESVLNSSNERFREADKAAQKFFRGLVIGGFAMQQLGGFMIANVTMPLIQLGKTMLESLLVFDDFNERMKVAGRSAEQIKEINDVAVEVAKRPNITLQETVTLFGKLDEITKGSILPKQLKEIGFGLSAALSGVEAKERNPVLGELLDILSGGGTSNLNKTLNNAVRLKKAIKDLTGVDDITETSLAQAGYSQTEAVMEGLKVLAKEDVANSLRNQIEVLSDRFFVLGGRIAKVYEQDLKGFLSMLDTVAGKIENFVDWLDRSSGFTKGFALAIAGVTLAIGPLAFAIGTLSVVVGGFVFLFDTIVGFLGLATASVVTLQTTTAGLAVTVGQATGSWSVLVNILKTGLAALTPLYAIVAGLVLLAVNAVIEFEFVRNELILLLATFKELLFATLELSSALGSIIGPILYYVLKALSGILGLGMVVAFRTLTIVVAGLASVFRGLAAALRFIVDIASNKTWTLMWKELELALKEIQLSIIEVIPGLERLMDALSQRNGQQTLRQQAAALREYLQTQEGSNAALEKKQELEAQQKAKVAQQKKDLSDLTRLLKDQRREIDALTTSLEESAIRSRNSAAENKAAIQIAFLSRRQSTFDLANPKQAQQALADLRQTGKLKLEQAQRDLDLEKLTKENEFRREMSNALLDLEVTDAKLSGIVRDAIKSAKTSDELIYELGTYLQRDLNERPEMGANVGSLIEFVQGWDIRLRQMREGYKYLNGELLKVRSEQKIAEQALEENIKKAVEELALTKDSQKYEDLLSLLRQDEAKLQQQESELRQLDISYTERLARFRKIGERLVKVRAEMVQTQYNLAMQNATEAQRVEATGERDRQMKEIVANQNLSQANFINNLSNVSDGWAKAYDDATVALKEGRDSQDRFFQILDEISSRQGIRLYSAGSLSSITSNMMSQFLEGSREIQSIARQLGSIFGPDTESGLAQTALAKFAKMLVPVGTQVAVQDQIKEQVLYLEDLIKAMLSIDVDKLREGGDVTSAADLTKMLQVAVQSLTRLKQLQNEISDQRLADRQREQEASLNDRNRRLAELRDAAELLEIERDILATRVERLLGSNRGSVIGNIADILMGSQRQMAELEQRRLETLREIKKLEMELAIARLEIEIEITYEQLKRNDPKLAESYKNQRQREIDFIRKKGELEQELIEAQIAQAGRYGATFGSIFGSAMSKVIQKVFGKKKKGEKDPVTPETVPGAVDTEDANASNDAIAGQIDWLDKLGGKMGQVRDIVFGLGDALLSLEEITVSSVLRAIKEELDALAKKAIVRALEFTAIALSALVFGDIATAKRAGKAAAAWGAVAVAAKVGSAIVGLGVKENEAAAQSRSDSRAQTSSDAEKRRRIAKMQASQITVKFDIKTEEGILVRKQVQAINKNTQLTTLSSNQQQGFRFTPV